MDSKIRIGDIYLIQFTGTDSEQKGWRPGVVFQNNIGNANSPNIIALPLTSVLKRTEMPTHVYLDAAENGLRRNSVVLCESPERVSKGRLGCYITRLSDKKMKEIAIGSLLASSVISYIDRKTLLEVWQSAVNLNRERLIVD